MHNAPLVVKLEFDQAALQSMHQQVYTCDGCSIQKPLADSCSE